MKRLLLTIIMSLTICMTFNACAQKENDPEETVEEDIKTESKKDKKKDKDKKKKETEEEVTPEAKETDTEKEKAPDVDYEAVYAPIIDQIRDDLQGGYDPDIQYDQLPVGIMEQFVYGDTNDMLRSFGYKIIDVNEDNIPELLIGRNDDYSQYGEKDRCYIVAGYSYDGSETYQFLEGWTRNAYYWLGDGRFFYFGSGGAAISIFGECRLDKDSKEFVWKDYYFSDDKKDGSIAYYHNTTGKFDTSASEEIDKSGDEFWEMADSYDFKLLDLIPFGGSDVWAVWADDVVDDSTNYISYEPENIAEYTTHVLFYVKEDVKNFKIVELFAKNISDDGHIEFLYEERFKLDTLTPDKPVCAGMNFYGTIPNNGYMYTDNEGNDHLFVLEQSGKDGSLYVWEYK